MDLVDMHICSLAPGMVSEKKKLSRALLRAIELSDTVGVCLVGSPLSELLQDLRQQVNESIARNLEKR